MVKHGSMAQLCLFGFNLLNAVSNNELKNGFASSRAFDMHADAVGGVVDDDGLCLADGTEHPSTLRRRFLDPLHRFIIPPKRAPAVRSMSSTVPTNGSANLF